MKLKKGRNKAILPVKALIYSWNLHFTQLSVKRRLSAVATTEKKIMADSEIEKKLLRLKKDELKEEAKKLNLDTTGTKVDLVRFFSNFFVCLQFLS